VKQNTNLCGEEKGKSAPARAPFNVTKPTAITLPEGCAKSKVYPSKAALRVKGGWA
jgi:hypothetical protein